MPIRITRSILANGEVDVDCRTPRMFAREILEETDNDTIEQSNYATPKH